MKQSTAAQHEVDKANFTAAKAEAKANFEENRGHNTYQKAKAAGKKCWDDARMCPAKRAAKAEQQRQEQLAAAQARTADAEERYQAAKRG